MILVALLSGIACVVCAFLFIYPYAIYPMILRRLPTKRLQRDPAHRCSATLVFCAYNEARVIGEKLQNIELLRRRHPDLQVLAFDDGSSDSTYEQLAARPDLLTVIRGGGRNGKAYGMKLLAAQATGDIIVFTDANVTLREDAIDNLMAWYGDKEVGGICGSLHYVGDEASVTAAVGSAYWRLEEYLKKEESRTGNVMGGDGSIFSLRRELYPDFPNTVLDDLTVSMAAVFAGKRLIKVEDVVAFEGLVAARGEEFTRKVRIASRAYHTHMYLGPQLAKMAPVDKFKYGSRKILRWFGGLFLIVGALAGLVSIAAISLPAGFAALILLALLVLLGSRLQSGPVATVAEICLALMATLLGVIKALRGKTVAVWSPAKSR